MLDLIVPVRPGENDELRYAARSWCANLPHDRLVVAGGKPDWLTSCMFLRVNPRPHGPHRNALTNLRTALSISELSDDVIVANDDHFALQPLEQVPTLHRGPLAEVAAHSTRHAHAIRSRGAHATLDLLFDLGFTDPLCYDLHAPGVVNRAGLVDTLDRIALLAAPHDVPLVWWRTVYGNLADLGGEYSDDVKVRSLTDPLPTDGPFVSTCDRSFAHGLVGADLRARFTDPCRYERTTDADGA